MTELRGFYRRIGTDSVYLVTGTLISSAATFAIGVALARGMGVSGFGRYAFLIGAVGLTSGLCDLGIPTALTRTLSARAAGSGGSSATVRMYMKALLVSSLVAGVLVAGGLVWVAPRRPTLDPSFLLVAAVPLVVAYSLVRGNIAALNGLRRMDLSLVGMILQEPTKLLVVAALWALGCLDLNWLVICWIVPAVGTALVTRRMRNRAAGPSGGTDPRPEGPQYPSLLIPLRTGLPFYLPFLGITIMPALMGTILGFAATSSDVGLFAAAAGMVSLSALAFVPFMNVLLPAFSSRFAADGVSLSAKEFSAGALIMGIATWCVFGAYLLLGRAVLLGVYGEAYAMSVPVLWILAGANALETHKFVINPILNGAGHPGKMSAVEAARLTVMIILGCVFSALWGAKGAALAVLAASMVSFLSRMLVFGRVARLNVWAYAGANSAGIALALWFLLRQ